MNAHAALHPTDQTLSSFGLGKLDDRSAEAVSKHLEQCPNCRQRFAELSADSFLGRIREAQKPASESMLGHSLHGGTQSGKGTNAPALASANNLPPGLADHPDHEIKREPGQRGMVVVYLAPQAVTTGDRRLFGLSYFIRGRSRIVAAFI